MAGWRVQRLRLLSLQEHRVLTRDSRTDSKPPVQTHSLAAIMLEGITTGPTTTLWTSSFASVSATGSRSTRATLIQRHSTNSATFSVGEIQELSRRLML